MPHRKVGQHAIANSVVAKYDRETGERVAGSTGAARHLNSGFFHDGQLYCAHSNYPLTPEQSEIIVLDVDSMELSTFHEFGNFGGSFVPETLMVPLAELTRAYQEAVQDPGFQDELASLLRDYSGRPTPLTRAQRFCEALQGVTVYLKREDLEVLLR